MCVPSITCSLSLSEPITCQEIMGVSLAAIGAIATLAGILALSGVPGLNALNTTHSAILTGLGGLTLIVGLAVALVKTKAIPDVRPEEPDMQDVVDYLDQYQKSKEKPKDELVYSSEIVLAVPQTETPKIKPKEIDWGSFFFPILSPEEIKAGEYGRKVGKQVAVLFEKKLQKKHYVKKIFCDWIDATIRIKALVPKGSKFECSVWDDKIDSACQNPAYSNCECITLLLPWPQGGGSFTKRVETVWKSFNQAIDWWQDMKNKIEMSCYEGDRCKLIPSSTVTKLKLELYDVQVTEKQNQLSVFFESRVHLESNLFGENGLNIRGLCLKLADDTELSDCFADLRMRIMESFDEGAKERVNGINLNWLFELKETKPEVSLGDIEALDLLLDCKGDLIDAYKQKDKTRGLALTHKKNLLKFHSDKAAVLGLDADVQAKFPEIRERLPLVYSFFQSL